MILRKKEMEENFALLCIIWIQSTVFGIDLCDIYLLSVSFLFVLETNVVDAYFNAAKGFTYKFLLYKN